MKRSRALALALASLASGAGCSSRPEPQGTTPVVDPVVPAPNGPEAGAPEAEAPRAADPRCSPRDVSTFVPTWKPPAPRQHVCTDEQLAALAPCWMGDSKGPECERFWSGPAADRACGACVETWESGDVWGPIVHAASKRRFLNTPGCIALVEPSREACAKDTLSTEACAAVACYASCFSKPDISQADKDACAEGATLGGCKPYTDRAVLCQVTVEQSHSPAEACLVDPDEAGFRTVARLFCGT